jgi:hypothetical protein
MKTVLAALAIALIGSLSSARAAPPTVTPSPGYDRALAASRDARAEPVVAQPRTILRYKRKIRRH